jgi:hypothetical protein
LARNAAMLAGVEQLQRAQRRGERIGGLLTCQLSRPARA